MPWSNKDLKIKWEHFVSKLTPGGKETWTAVITGPNAKTAAAEMVAGMYDASLDAFVPHAWANQIANLFYQDYSQISLRYRNQAKHLNGFHHNLRRPQKNANARFRYFNNQIVDNARTWSDLWHDIQPAHYRYFGPGGFGGRVRTASFEDADEEVADFSNATRANKTAYRSPALVADKAREASVSGRGQSGNSSGPNLDQVSARTNLQETAFFYPHLIAGDNGEVRIEFTIPEALTKWKFLGFAHDACLLYTSPSPRDRTRSRMPSSA